MTDYRSREREFASEFFDPGWPHSPDACARCSCQIYDAMDEQLHYFEGMCGWCSHMWAKLKDE